MALFITSLNSGSNGNCYYIGNKTEAVLIDAGISCRETEKRMKRLELPMSNVKAIFVSHEHADHINGIRVLSKKYQLPVYITSTTLRSAGFIVEKSLIRTFIAEQPVVIDGLTVTAFSKFHDASDPHSFMVSSAGINVGVLTDIGTCCKHVTTYFKQCHAAFLEANYCDEMLMNGSYPYILKRRISSDSGHLSNAQALELFTKHRGSKLTHLVLSHLSKNNNKPEIVDQLFKQQAGSTKIIVASRYEETAVFCIEPGENEIVKMKKDISPARLQLSLF
jgi:phosphoribosyl 1,2-cyclic phosphodiesterase